MEASCWMGLGKFSLWTVDWMKIFWIDWKQILFCFVTCDSCRIYVKDAWGTYLNISVRQSRPSPQVKIDDNEQGSMVKVKADPFTSVTKRTSWATSMSQPDLSLKKVTTKIAWEMAEMLAVTNKAGYRSS